MKVDLVLDLKLHSVPIWTIPIKNYLKLKMFLINTMVLSRVYFLPLDWEAGVKSIQGL